MNNKMLKPLCLCLLLTPLFACDGSGLDNTTSINPSQPNYKVYGLVLDTNGAGVNNVELILSTKGTKIATVITNEKGEYSFSNLSTGNYEMLLVPPSDSYQYDGEKVKFSYIAEQDLQMRDIVFRKTNFTWGELS
jgi:hypothetical protein